MLRPLYVSVTVFRGTSNDAEKDFVSHAMVWRDGKASVGNKVKRDMTPEEFAWWHNECIAAGFHMLYSVSYSGQPTRYYHQK